MGSQATSSNQIIALPKGGGAQKGLGEKFSPDLHTGTSNFTVPIALPPGHSGFQPQFNLVHSTGNWNGYFGLGWSLSIPEVMRTTSKGILRYRDDEREVANWDTFALSVEKNLVPVEAPSRDPLKATRSRLRPDGLIAESIHHHDPKMIRINDWTVCSNAEIDQRKVNCHARPHEVSRSIRSERRGFAPEPVSWSRSSVTMRRRLESTIGQCSKAGLISYKSIVRPDPVSVAYNGIVLRQCT